jgi:hypothetical protein
MRRFAVVSMLVLLCAGPAAAQATLTFGTGDDFGGNSTANVTTEQVTPAPDGGFTSATVLSGVNIRNAPSTQNSEIIGTLAAGDVVAVRCSYGWCELANGGYTAEKFLSLDGQSFDVVAPPADGTISTGDAPAVTAAITAPDAIPSVAANFDGLWTATGPAGKPGMPLILKQDGNSVTGTFQTTERLAKLSGAVEGRMLNFTYDMLNKAGKTIASGNGFLKLSNDNARLSGVLMLNGLVVSNIKATH